MKLPTVLLATPDTIVPEVLCKMEQMHQENPALYSLYILPPVFIQPLLPVDCDQEHLLKPCYIELQDPNILILQDILRPHVFCKKHLLHNYQLLHIPCGLCLYRAKQDDLNHQIREGAFTESNEKHQD